MNRLPHIGLNFLINGSRYLCGKWLHLSKNLKVFCMLMRPCRLNASTERSNGVLDGPRASEHKHE